MKRALELRAKVEGLEKACVIADSLLAEVMSIHSDKQSDGYNDCDTDPCMWCEQAKAARAAMQKEQAGGL